MWHQTRYREQVCCWSAAAGRTWPVQSQGWLNGTYSSSLLNMPSPILEGLPSASLSNFIFAVLSNNLDRCLWTLRVDNGSFRFTKDHCLFRNVCTRFITMRNLSLRPLSLEAVTNTAIWRQKSCTAGTFSKSPLPTITRDACRFAQIVFTIEWVSVWIYMRCCIYCTK